MNDKQRAFYQELGLQIRDTRRAAGMNQQQLADAIGFARTSIVNIEAGRQGITVHLLMDISDALGIDVDVYFSRIDESGEGYIQRALSAEARVHELERQIETAKRRAAMLFR